jgi:hypothetical protein
MKKLFFIAALCLLSLGATAQIETPAPSPAASLTQTVGLTDISIDYSRPSMKGRTVYGNLVPYGKVWRTGANARTKITFSTDVTIGGEPLKAGTYALFTKPEASSWTVYFYTEYQGGGAPAEWDDSKVAAMVKVKAQNIPMDIETFTITMDDLTNNGANLGIMWEKTYVGVPIGVPANDTVLAAIEKTMKGPSAGDFYNAAVYLASTDQKLETAKEYMDKAMSMIKEPRFWQLRQQSLLLAKTGDTKGAIKAAKASLKGATAAGNADYVKLNADSLKEWGAK